MTQHSRLQTIMKERSDWAIVLVAAPVVVLVAAWLLVLAVALAAEHPLWGLTPRNLAEAAAFRDGGAIVRGVWRGEDPAAPGEVRAGFISREPVIVTPLEAAARASREEIVRLLLDLGGPLDAAAWTRVWCSAEAPAVRAELAAVRPDDASVECTSFEF